MNHDTHIPSHILACVLICPHTIDRITPEVLDAMASYPDTTPDFMEVFRSVVEHDGSVVGAMLAIKDMAMLEHVRSACKYIERLVDIDHKDALERTEKMLGAMIGALMRAVTNEETDDTRSFEQRLNDLRAKRQMP